MVAKGIVSNGLGANCGPSTQIISQFNLGFFEVIIEEITPPAPSPGGGGAGVIYRPSEEDQIRVIRISVKHKDKTWTKIFRVSRKQIQLYVWVTNVINRITTDIYIRVGKAKRFFNKIRIKM